MYIIIDLRDHENKSHLSIQLGFQAQGTIQELKDRIRSTFGIPQDNQQITNNTNDRIDLFIGSVENAGIQNNERLILRHSMLSNWSALLEHETAFQQTYEKDVKKSIYLDAKGLIETLAHSRFFLAYPTLGTRRFKIEIEFSTYFDGKVEAMKNSCRSYFEKIYGHEQKVTFESRESGSRVGCLCIVDDGVKVKKFYVKIHDAGDNAGDTRYDVDLRELFAYKLLEELKMGSEIHFIDTELNSKWIIFIGSKEISGFKTLECLEMTQPQSLKKYTKAVVQMLFVFSVLMLGDHHTANMGLNDELHPFIVDFFISGKPMFSVKDLYDFVHMAKKFNLIMSTFDERLKLSMEYLKDSNFSAVFEKSVDTFFQDQKSVLDKSIPGFDKLKKTNDLNKYVDNVRKNIKLFVDYSFNEE